MKLWHPLKLTSLCYIAVDVSLSLGGVAYTNFWIGLCGVIGMFGNGIMLLGGSGQKYISSPLLRRIAPYAERTSMALYAVQNIPVIVSGFISYDRLLWGEIGAGMLGFIGCSVALLWPRDARIPSYRLAGIISCTGSVVFTVAGIDSGNLGVLASGIFGILGNIFLIISRRAEFQPVTKY